MKNCDGDYATPNILYYTTPIFLISQRLYFKKNELIVSFGSSAVVFFQGNLSYVLNFVF